MNLSTGRLVRLCRKELRETLRDRRTIITLVLMPLLIYPLLSMTLNRFLLSAQSGTAPSFRVQTATADEAEFLQMLLHDPRSHPPQAIRDAAGDLPLARFEFYVSTDDRPPAEALLAGNVQVAASATGDLPKQVRFVALEGDAASQQARRILIERMQWYNASVYRERLEQVRAEAAEPPLVVETSEIEGEADAPLLATVVPLMLVLMTITGAVYPAIDLTAGERERGTIEAVIASPVPRGAVLFAKYTAVVTVALLTAVINLFAMFLTLWASGLLHHLLGADAAFPWVAILQTLVLLVLFSGFFSAVLLALTSFARSFKEAQAYLVPLMLLSLAPAMMSLLPGIQLAGPLAVMPLVNIILLTRDVLAGEAAVMPAAAAVVSTIIYAAAALTLAARLFGSDAVLRSSELSIGSLFARPERPRAVPSVSEAAMTMALLFPIYFVTSNVLAQFGPASMGGRLVVNALALIVLFGGIPLAVALLSRDRLKSTFRLRACSPLALFGAFAVGLGLWAFAFEATLLGEMIGIGSLDPDLLQRADDTKQEMQRLSPLLLLVTFAVTPGVIEELCYRGYLFSAFGRRLGPWRTILLCALLFGLFHVLTGNVLKIERMIPSTLVGIVLGWVSWRAGSLYPAIILHFTHDALLMMVIRYEETLKRWGWDVSDGEHLPAVVLTAAAVAVLVGVVFVGLGTKPSEERKDKEST
ncbi:ABC transporter permease subunit/CPBP intramembrane protease [Roseimaritima sediminicola]|uniref:ABC transporter permease subunit/CPBP intramembrane protease n=1 Tax=Roseimaritima sediminicola TaxID=2662066 RepID=UPI001298326F|nr:ABC transporter permease subunit/CPBP intramembrane protease [Roseimaritima sediminicola]